MWLMLVFTLFLIYYFYVIGGSRVKQEKLRAFLKSDSPEKIINYIEKARKRYMIHFNVMNIFSKKETKENGKINYDAMFSTYRVYFFSLYGDFGAAEKELSLVNWDKVTEQFIFNRYLAQAVFCYMRNDNENALNNATTLSEKVRSFFGGANSIYNPTVIKKYYNFYDSYVYIGNLLLGNYDDMSVQNLKANFDIYKSSDIITSLLAAKALKKYYTDSAQEEPLKEVFDFVTENASSKINI